MLLMTGKQHSIATLTLLQYNGFVLVSDNKDLVTAADE
jgi:hypothetical protein